MEISAEQVRAVESWLWILDRGGSTPYLVAVADSAHAPNNEERRAALRNAASTKARIAVYGGREVIRALVDFENSGARIVDTEGKEFFLVLISAMRNNAEVSKTDIEILLLGSNA
ncbi:hypothetical protein [Herbaspirillum rhizosphaerae]|uniref:hypothetical protein n=1 Tax=Herbaspirillum rhizosphaerae TaxID=346179 RepID=UPI0012EE9357|nr:hypothetical protein [Herbaspirillum rhizosphaerae]